MTEHLSENDIQRYRQRTLPPKEMIVVTRHIAECPVCRRELFDEKQLQASFESLKANLLAAAKAETEDSSDEQSSFWKKFLAFWQMPSHWIPLQLAGAAAVVLLCIWVTTRPLKNQVADLQAKVRQFERTDDDVQRLVSNIGELKNQLVLLQRENGDIQQNYKTASKTIADLQIKLAQFQQSPIPNPKSQILFVLNNGDRRMTLDKQGNLTGLPPLPPSLQQEVKTTLTVQQVKKPTLIAALLDNQERTRGAPPDGLSFALRSPVTTAVRTDRPALRWQPFDGATGYVVEIHDPQSQFYDKVAETEKPISETEWTVPKPLMRGKDYTWHVIPYKDGERIDNVRQQPKVAKFKVLQQKEADELEDAKQKYANSPLILGVLYTQYGLLDDAEQEFQSLRDANPKSPVARKLFNSVQSLRRKQ
jgi:hypothetical protein